METKEEADLGSTHMTYTMVQGVLQVFRRRISNDEAILFSGTLPVGLRALFVADWDPYELKRPFENRAEMTREVKELRKNHNFAVNDSISIVAKIIRRYVDEEKFNAVLSKMSPDAQSFWSENRD